MPLTLDEVKALVTSGCWRASEHAVDEALAEGISLEQLAADISSAELLEKYPDDLRGMALLALQWDARGDAVHVVWGKRSEPGAQAVIVTVYRPEPPHWVDERTRSKES
jgi:hypothetical protein